MISLNFQIVPEYVIYHAIVNSSPHRLVDGVPPENIVEFQKAAKSKDETACDFLNYGVGETNVLASPTIAEVAQRTENFIQTMKADSTFASVLKETINSLEHVRSEWERNLVKTDALISDWTGLPLTGEFRIFLTHPALKQGHYLGRLKAICWANRNTWPNYNTVYLWHELLHNFMSGGDLEHAIIQLITDNELRIRLNGGSYPPFEGHPDLSKLMEAVLPHWKSYLAGKERNINLFIKEMSALPEVEQLKAHDDRRNQ
ncbi:MAG TPA: hypothetical protein V6C69_09570 [Trichormus sp.]|jgi:hypothetical protein